VEQVPAVRGEMILRREMEDFRQYSHLVLPRCGPACWSAGPRLLGGKSPVKATEDARVLRSYTLSRPPSLCDMPVRI